MILTTTIHAVKKSLSPARMTTYEAATANEAEALMLYVWNAQVSAALLMPLHICEVVMRNTVSEALEATYGHRWPWSQGFERSLPNPPVGYNSCHDLHAARRTSDTTGKLIPELKFVFWQKMFTSRHDTRLWDRYLFNVLPNVDQNKSASTIRQSVYQDLEVIRTLRNRIAHHEPIFNRNLAADFQLIENLIKLRCRLTADWMVKHQQALSMINDKP